MKTWLLLLVLGVILAATVVAGSEEATEEQIMKEMKDIQRSEEADFEEMEQIVRIERRLGDQQENEEEQARSFQSNILNLSREQNRGSSSAGFRMNRGGMSGSNGEDQFQRQRSQSSKGQNLAGKSPGNSMTVLGENMRHGVNKKLNPELLSNIEALEKEKIEAKRREALEIQCMKIPRKFARPVEITLRNCQTDGSADFQQILGFGCNVTDPIQLKKKLRDLSVVLHPDKNPHPQAKDALSCIQNAYLKVATARPNPSNSTRSASTHTLLSSLPRCKKHLSLRIDSAIARIKLFNHRLFHGQWRAEYDELVQQPISALRFALIHVARRFYFAPTVADKISLFLEGLYDNRLAISVGLLLALIFKLYPFVALIKKNSGIVRI